MLRPACLPLLLLLAGPARAADRPIDLTRATVVAPAGLSDPERRAVALLVEEVERRTGLRLPVAEAWPPERPVIAVGPAQAVKGFAGRFAERLAAEGAPPGREGFRLRVEADGSPAAVLVVGNDARGVLFGVGRLLRALHLERGRLAIQSALSVYTAPRAALRAHQIGPVGGAEGWAPAAAEQYVRDLAVFGANGIELVLAAGGEAEAAIPLARTAAELGLAVSVWWPPPARDEARALAEADALFARLPRLDAVVVAAGEGGRLGPRALLSAAERQAQAARKRHAQAQVWIAPSDYGPEAVDELIALLGKEPPWLNGVVYGAGLRAPGRDLRRQVPERYQLRFQPDVTNTSSGQYPVADWDLAFALTAGRTPVNPRPAAMTGVARAMRRLQAFVTRSEGAHDDVNKVVWAAFGWDEGADLMDVLRQYGRYFVGPGHEDAFAQALVALERNWQGPLLANQRVYTTLRQLEALERRAGEAGRASWRLQQALFRATFDAYVRARLVRETALEDEALSRLRGAREGTTLAALEQAEAVLARAVKEPVAPDWRARLTEIADLLRRQGIRSGAGLERLDAPLGDRAFLGRRIAEIRALSAEGRRLRAIDELLGRADPGPGGFYDDLGRPGAQPHLVRSPVPDAEPGALEPVRPAFALDAAGRPLAPEAPRATWDVIEASPDESITLRYTGLDRRARYRVRVTYAGPARVRLVADDRIVHPYQAARTTPVEADVPEEATRDGDLTLVFSSAPGGPGPRVAAVWLLRR